MTYKIMWNELKKHIEDELEYHESGKMQSMMEAINGKIFCTNLLQKMEAMERESYYE